MLWGWGGAKGKGTMDEQVLGPVPTHSKQRKLKLPVAPGFPGAPCGPWRPERKEGASVTLWPGVFSQQASGPCPGPGALQAVSFSLCLCVSSLHAHTEAHVCACVSTWCAGACVGSSRHHHVLLLFAHPPP